MSGRRVQLFATRVRKLPWAIRGLNPPMTREFRRHNDRWVERATRAVTVATVPERQADVLLCVVIGMWNDGDIAYAAVRHAFEQGAQRVFVIDDESDDDTCSEAEAAGAEVLRFTSTGQFDNPEQMKRFRRLIDEQTQLAGTEVWWLLLDADEFVDGPNGSTIAEFIAGLDPHVNVVGARVLDHYPSGEADYAPRTDPVAAQPLARWRNHPCCPWGHWKHPLLRFREPGEITVLGGYHRHQGRDGKLIEADDSLLMHHIQFRNRAFIEAKYQKLFGPGGRVGEKTVYESARQRLDILDLVYRQRWDSIRSLFPEEPRHGIELVDWHSLVPEAERRHGVR